MRPRRRRIPADYGSNLAAVLLFRKPAVTVRLTFPMAGLERGGVRGNLMERTEMLSAMSCWHGLDVGRCDEARRCRSSGASVSLPGRH